MAQYGILGSSMESRLDISYLTDTVVLLRYFEAAGQVRKAISVVKKRSGGHEDTVRELKIGPDRILIGHPLEQFQVLLAGVPTYVGDTQRLLDTNRLAVVIGTFVHPTGARCRSDFGVIASNGH
jgi:circadian clock protein KaiC